MENKQKKNVYFNKWVIVINITIVLMILLGLRYCNREIDIQYLPKKEMSYEELPDTVKYYYLKVITEPKITIINKDTSISYGDWDTLICLDKDICKCKHETKWIITWLDKEVFYINDKIFIMGYNGNTINPPWILYRKKMYFLLGCTNPRTKEDVIKTRFIRYDLRKFLE